MDLVKYKIKKYLLSFLKMFFYQIAFFGVIVLAIIMSVGVVFSFFSSYLGTDNYNLDSDSLEEWANSLTNSEIMEIQDSGASINPKKIPLYLRAEDNSYLKNVSIKIPIETETVKNGSSKGTVTTYEDYLYTRGDASYPYRLWWQMLAGLDTVNNTSLQENERRLINDIIINLSPSYTWSDPKTSTYNNGNKYGKTSDKEKMVKTIITTVVKTYKNNSLISEDKTVVTEKKTYPLAYLSEIETMFADYSFNYAYKSKSESSGVQRSYNYWEDIRVVPKTNIDNTEVDGEAAEPEVEEVVDEYYSETTVNVSRITGTWELNRTSINYTDKYLSFLLDKGFDINTTAELIYHMSEYLPQSYDFMANYGEYLSYVSATNLGGFNGGFGGYFGIMEGYEIEPSELLRDIPLFMQTDSRWADFPYSYIGSPLHGTIGSSACGPVSMAMAIVGLGGYDNELDLNGDGIIDPYEATVYSLKKGHRIYGNGTAWSYFQDIGAKVGLNIRQVAPAGWRDVLNSLSQGDPVIASMGPGAFTSKGHYITLVGINENGRILVNDSNSLSRSKVSWDFARVVLPQAKQFWIVTNRE